MPNNSTDPTLAPSSARRVARQDDRRLVVLVANSKGGCGKTTLATNLAAYFAHSGQAVTLLDLDPQQSATQWVRLREDPRVEALGWPADEPVSLGRLQDQMQKARDVVARMSMGLGSTGISTICDTRSTWSRVWRSMPAGESITTTSRAFCI